MNVSFDGFSQEILTFMVSSDIPAGTPVDVVEGGYVETVSSGGDFSGVVIKCDGEYASVLMKGVVKVKCKDSSVSEGMVPLVSDGSGYATIGTEGIRHTVLEIDTDNKTATILM